MFDGYPERTKYDKKARNMTGAIIWPAMSRKKLPLIPAR